VSDPSTPAKRVRYSMTASLALLRSHVVSAGKPSPSSHYLIGRAALGDCAYKMHRNVLERIFLNADPPYVTPASRFLTVASRILTPPYMTNKAEIQHRKVDRKTNRFLVLASDGLSDLLSPDSSVLEAEHIASVAQAAGEAKVNGGALSAQVLRFAMGGSNMSRASQYLTVDMDGKAWMDDTTVICLRL
jgi:pyruvate dehydrogenase phosphatase